MTPSTKRMVRILAGAGIAMAALIWNGNVPMTGSTSLVSTAQAIIGRPATPMSYAGVARRTTARAVGYGAVGYGAAAAGAVAVGAAAAARCTQVVNAYGQVVTVCP